MVVAGSADLEGALDVTLGAGFDLQRGETFDLVETATGLTSDVTALFLDGDACSASAARPSAAVGM